jgi:HEAT repeat protein
MTVGAVCGLLDILSQIVTPEPLPDVKPTFDASTVFEPLKNTEFVRYAVAIGLATFSMNLVTPFQSPYVVDPARIGAPNTWLGIMQMLFQLSWIMCAPFWGTVMDRWGRKPVVISGTLLSLGWVGYLALTSSNYFIVLPMIAVVTGVLGPAFWEGTNQMMLSLAPEKNRVSYVAWYLAIVGLVSAPGSLAGGLLTDALAGFRMDMGLITITNFHVTQSLSILLCVFCAFLISRVKEGSEKPFGFVIGQIANPQIIRTFQNLDTLTRSRSPQSNMESLRTFDGHTAQLAIRDIVEKLDDPDASVQEEAARALGRIPSAQSVDALILRLLDQNCDIRAQAARSLGRIGDRRAVGALVGCLWENNEELQKACLESLADIGDEESIAQVMAFLRDNNSDRLRKISSSVAARLGVFEAAWEIFPSLLAARTKTSRRQYAIALASLLGSRDGFYQYTSGNASTLQSRQRKLIARFSENMAQVSARSRKGDNGIDFGRSEVEAVTRAFAEDKNPEALGAMIKLSKGLLASIFGVNADREMLGRVDRKLEVFSWMMDESRAYLDSPPEHTSAADVEDTARTVTLVAMYFLSEY